MEIKRRVFVKGAGAATALSILGAPFVAFGATRKVVVVGGGSGGATAAKYLRMADPTIEVTLIEPEKHYYTCYMSNEVLGGDRTIDTLRFGYDGLIRYGVNLVQDRVTAIDAEARIVTTAGGQRFDYERCIVAPGIAFRWEAIEGYDERVAETIPHAWRAGVQTLTLRKQLEAMPDGGTVLIAPPPNPYRCPAGPYERASLIAHYLKRDKPKSKIIILDAKPAFARQGLFAQAWKSLYGYQGEDALIEWHPSAMGSSDNAVVKVEARSGTVTTGLGDRIKGDVVNIIPPQKAGGIAFEAGLVDASGWCPVDLTTFESILHPYIHVIGDAAIAGSMPKTGFVANSEAKACAAGVAALLADRSPEAPAYVNTSYSIVGPDWGFSATAVYKPSGKDNTIKAVSAGQTPTDATPEMRKREVAYAHSWFANITRDIFM